MKMIITASSGNVTVRTTLYGEVNDARFIRERAITQHRASQLDTERRQAGGEEGGEPIGFDL